MLCIIHTKGTSVVGCLPSFKKERRFDNNEEENLYYKDFQIHYYHFISNYPSDNCDKERHLIKTINVV